MDQLLFVVHQSLLVLYVCLPDSGDPDLEDGLLNFLIQEKIRGC